jgi:hypothetical protein
MDDPNTLSHVRRLDVKAGILPSYRCSPTLYLWPYLETVSNGLAQGEILGDLGQKGRRWKVLK